MSRRVVSSLLVAAALILFSHFFFFYYRDNFSTHYPIKVLSAQSFRLFEVPWWNFSAGGGQPLAGNPNTLTFYPDNILYLFLPAHIAFNLHFLIHLLAGGVAIGALARRHGSNETTATLASLIYVLAGPVISALAFYNLITAVALLPLAFLALEMLLEAPSWRATLFLGSAFGLLALAGEPVTFLAALLCGIVLVAVRLRRNVGSALTRGLAAAAMAAIVAMPLLLAYTEIDSEVERSTWRFSTDTVLAASLTPSQLAESLLGPYRGLVTDLGPSGYRGNPGARGWPPLFISTLLGAVLIPAMFVPSRLARPYQWMILILLFIALGRYNPAVRFVLDSFPQARVIRYPEKLALPITVAAVVLIAMWLSIRRRSLAVTAGAALGLVLALGTMIAVLMTGGTLSEFSRRRAVIGAVLAIAVLACVLLSERIAIARKAAIVLTIAPLLYWATRTAPLDWSAPYRQRSPLLHEAAGMWQRVARPLEPEGLELSEPHERSRYRLKAQMLDPLFGAAHGIRYGLDSSPDGMYFTLSRILSERVETTPLPVQLRYLRLAGCSTLISRKSLDDPSLIIRDSADIEGNFIHRYDLSGAAAYVRSVREIRPVRSVQEAVRLIEAEQFDERETVIASAARAAAPTAIPYIRSVSRHGQIVRIDIEAQRGATLIVNETYFSAWDVRAFASDSKVSRSLTIFPANLDRLGIVIPPGRWTIDLRFGKRRHRVAASWVLSSLVLLGAGIALARRSNSRTASPAR